MNTIGWQRGGPEWYPFEMTFLLLLLLQVTSSHAFTVQVSDEVGHPLATVQVTEHPEGIEPGDTSDHGYPKANISYSVEPEVTGFTDALGRAAFQDRKITRSFRFRKPSFEDKIVQVGASEVRLKVVMKADADRFKRAESLPANIWLGALDVGTPEDKIHFKMQCGFCHQQGSPLTRRERSAEDWNTVIQRMVRYGSRLPTYLQKSLPEKLQSGFRKLREDPSLLASEIPWSGKISKVKITEWGLGNGFSQIHDVLTAKNQLVYVADNIQDRLYELDPKTNRATVYKIPHLEGDRPGGLIAGRLREFPSHDSTSNAHSLAESKVDGHLFITPSAQRRIIEFNPDDKSFKIHQMESGFYPHTIRIDGKDTVWFTLALSNQIGKFDRKTNQFSFYTLPTRSLREKIVVKAMPLIFRLIGKGIPLSNWLPVDALASGTPMPYGIDITPDGRVWFARLHTQEIGNIDPASGVITMILTPFHGPRRLRADADGNLWIVSFGDSLLAKFDPRAGIFRKFELPVLPVGSETPYSVFVDDVKKVVWVTGNQSDSVFTFDMKKESWIQIPLPKRRTFTRDFDRAQDGAIYTSNSHFPAWQVEGGQPTLIRIQEDLFSK